MHLREQIRTALAGLETRSAQTGARRDAAVVIPVFERDGLPHFLLTRRTHEVQTHKGQISFPGGMHNPGETLEETALREMFEEVGIPPSQIALLGRFHDYVSSTEFRVVPFAGLLEPAFTTVPQAGEVAEILHVPFSVFMDPGLMRVEKQFRLGAWMDVYFYRYERDEIWGLTARIIKDFLEQIHYGH